MLAFIHRLTIFGVVLCLMAVTASVFASPVQALLPFNTPPPGGGTSAAGDLFGTIEAPEGVDKYNADPRAGASHIGIIVFFSNLLRLITIVAGIWVMVNFIMAGLLKIQSADDANGTKKVYEKMTMSVIGLVIIVASYTLAGLISLILFGRADFILNPTLTGVS